MTLKPLIILLALSLQTITTFAEGIDRNPKQLELMFGIEEELRSGLAKRTYIGMQAAVPFLIHSAESTHGIAGLSMDMIALLPTMIYGVGTVNSIHDRKQETFITNILKECEKNGKFRCQRDKIKIHFYDPKTNTEIGYLRIGRDPMVIEATANPFKLKDLDGDMGEILEKSLYQTSKKTKLHPAQLGGQSHIHVDFASLFGGKDGKPIDYQFFRNYIVDWANHNELYYGALHYDPKAMGASPLLDTEEKRKKFVRWLAKYDSLLAKGQMDSNTFNNMRAELAHCGFRKGDAINVIPRTVDFGTLEKNFVDAKLGTIEIRCSRPSKNISELTRKLTIFEERARFIHNTKGLLPYYNPAAIQNAQEGVNRFALYLSESGLEWDEYKQVLPKHWQKKTPVKLPPEELFASGKADANICFRTFNRAMIHLFGR